jgi:hypothetical protein
MGVEQGVLEAGVGAEDQSRERTAARERAEESQRRAAERDRERLEALYERGQNALEQAQWGRAVEQFTVLATAGAVRADAAMYWRAYALDKLSQQTEALTTIAEMFKKFPASRWLGDHERSRSDAPAAGQPVSPATESTKA